MKHIVHLYCTCFILGPLRQDFIKIFRYYFFPSVYTHPLCGGNPVKLDRGYCVFKYRSFHRLCKLIVLRHTHWISTMPDDKLANWTSVSIIANFIGVIKLKRPWVFRVCFFGNSDMIVLKPLNLFNAIIN